MEFVKGPLEGIKNTPNTDLFMLTLCLVLPRKSSRSRGLRAILTTWLYIDLSSPVLWIKLRLSGFLVKCSTNELYSYSLSYTSNH